MSREAMRQYLADFGLLSCNENSYLPCLDSLGFSWADAVAPIDRQEVFVSKLYRRRTVYLSPEVYFLLKECRTPRPMTADAAVLYEALAAVPMESGELKRRIMSRPCTTAPGSLLIGPAMSTVPPGPGRPW